MNNNSLKQTDIGLIPDDWEIIDFENSLSENDFSRNHLLNSSDFKNEGAFPVIDQGQDYIAGYSDNSEKVFHIKEPLVVFGDHTRIFKYVDFPFIGGADGIKVFTPNRELFYPRFFYFALTSLSIPSRGYNRHYKLLKERKVIKPPLPEQQKIAYVLSKIQQAIETQEQIIKTTQELKKALMQKLFTEGLNNEPQKQTEIGLIPQSWEVKRIDEIADDFLGGGTPSTSKPEFWNGEIHWTTSKRLDPENIFLFDGEKKITKIGLTNSSTHLILQNNLVVSTRVTVGKVAINKVDIAISQDLTGLLIDKTKYSLEFLAYSIYTDRIQKIFEAQKRGATIKGITREDLKEIKLAIPNLHTQNEVARVLSSVDLKISFHNNNKTHMQELFKTMLNQLMSGQIRVKDIEFKKSPLERGFSRRD